MSDGIREGAREGFGGRRNPTDGGPALWLVVLPWLAASLVLRAPLRRVAGTAPPSPAPRRRRRTPTQGSPRSARRSFPRWRNLRVEWSGT